MNYITTRTGVRIGICYQRPLPRIEGHAATLQAALLEPKTARPLGLLARLFGRVWQWL